MGRRREAARKRAENLPHPRAEATPAGVSERDRLKARLRYEQAHQDIVGGRLGLVSHLPGGKLIGRGLEQVSTAMVYSPYGAYRAATQDPRKTLRELAEGIASDFRHPGENPGFLALDLLGALTVGAGTAVRGGAALGKLAEEGSVAARVGGAGRALAHAPEPGLRTLRVGGLEATAPAARNPVYRGLQRGHDVTVQKLAAPGNRAEKLLTRKAGKWLAAERRVTDALAKADASALAKAGRSLSAPQQLALRVVAEGVPIEERILKELEWGHPRQVKLLGLARQYVTEGDAPKLRHAGLGAVYERVVKSAKSRDEILAAIGHLAPEIAAGRVSGPARIYAGARYEAEAGLVGGEEAAGRGAVRVPYAKRKGRRSLGQPPTVGSQGVVGYPRKPGSLSHPFKGELLRSGKWRGDTTRLVAESELEAHRYATVLRIRDQLKDAALPNPPEGRVGGDYIPIRLDNLKSKPLPVLQDVLHKAEEGAKLTRTEKHQLGAAFRGFVEEVFPDPAAMSASEQAAFQKLWEEGKVGWVHRNLLRDLDTPYIGPGAGGLAAATQVADSINNAFRLSVLYLKPAYAAPNILGNAALNLVQQGFAAPLNLKRAARLNSKLGLDATERLDAVMGEGFALALQAQGGVGQTVVHNIAQIWSKGVDRPFRRSAFIYEARRKGFRTPERLHDLLTNPKHEKTVVQIGQRANREIIDYGNLGPLERKLIRRVVLFYPWVKGSTTYAAHFIAEHPIKAGGAAQLGRNAQAEAPDAPSFLQGVFDVNGKLVNPSAAALLQTPAQVAQSGLALAGLGPTVQASKFSQFLSPPLALGISALTHTDPRRGEAYPPNMSGEQIAKEQLFNNLPQVRLYQRIHEARSGRDFSKRLFPPSVDEALEQFGVGGLAPRTYNKKELAREAEQEYLSTIDPAARRGYRSKRDLKKAVAGINRDARWLRRQTRFEPARIEKFRKQAITDERWLANFKKTRDSAIAEAKKHGEKLTWRERLKLLAPYALAKLDPKYHDRAETLIRKSQAGEYEAKATYYELLNACIEALKEFNDAVPDELERNFLARIGKAR